jgi:hypothetical protein
MKTKGHNMETLYKDDELPSHLQRLVDAGVNGLDIMHGELKNLMLIAEEQLAWAQSIENETEEAMDSMARTECEGRLDTLVELYKLTYDLSFAIGARDEASR